jgi:hypothetical protein
MIRRNGVGSGGADRGPSSSESERSRLGVGTRKMDLSSQGCCSPRRRRSTAVQHHPPPTTTTSPPCRVLSSHDPHRRLFLCCVLCVCAHSLRPRHLSLARLSSLVGPPRYSHRPTRPEPEPSHCTPAAHTTHNKYSLPDPVPRADSCSAESASCSSPSLIPSSPVAYSTSSPTSPTARVEQPLMLLV